MDAKVKIIFADIPVEEAQKDLLNFLDKLKEENKVKDYEFEIKTKDGGVVTQRCILEQGKVIA